MNSTVVSTADIVLIMSVFFALIPAAVCYLARWWLDRGRIEPPWMIPLLMVVGGASGLFFAYFGYGEIVGIYGALLGVDNPSDPLLYTALFVPTAEELGKLFVLLPFVLTRWFRGPVDGIVYGLAVGAGFACLENFAYFASAYAFGGTHNWVAEISIRAIPSAVIHGAASATVGAFLGAARFDDRRLVIVASPFVGFLGALLIHGGWNGLISIAPIAPEVTMLGVLTLLPICAAGLAVALVSAVRVESEAIARELSLEVEAGRLGPQELSAIISRKDRRHANWLADGALRGRLIGAAMDLGLSLHHHRRHGRGGRRIEALRARVTKSRGAADAGPPPGH